MKILLTTTTFTFAILALATEASGAPSSVQFTTQVTTDRQVTHPQVVTFIPAAGSALGDFYFGVTCSDQYNSWFYIDKAKPPPVNDSGYTDFEFTNGKDSYKFQVKTSRYAFPESGELNKNVATPFCEKPDRVIHASRFRLEVSDESPAQSYPPTRKLYQYDLSCANGRSFAFVQYTGNDASWNNCDGKHWKYTLQVRFKNTPNLKTHVCLADPTDIAAATKAFDDQLGELFCR